MERKIFVALCTIIVLLAGIFYNTRTIECGACGAHVHEWWQVENMEGTELVGVCEHCYLLAMED